MPVSEAWCEAAMSEKHERDDRDWLPATPRVGVAVAEVVRVTTTVLSNARVLHVAPR